MRQNNNALLEIKNLCLEYRNDELKTTALDGVNLTLEPGQRLGLIGESGCGKTSLAMAVMGLLNKVSLSGSIRFNGKELLGLGEKKMSTLRWNRMAMVFQNSQEVFNPVITVGEQVGEALCRHLDMDRAGAAHRVEALFNQVGLDPAWRKAYAHQLSGGMRQRVLIAMALACEPDLLIVDEPFTALDADSRRAMADLIATLQKRLGFAMLLISHSMPAIAELTEKTITLYAGQVLEAAPTADLLAEPFHPYTRGLINACPEFFGYKDLWGIPGLPPAPGTSAGCPFFPRCVQHGPDCPTKRPALVPAGKGRRVACHKGGIATLLSASGLEKTYFLNGRPIKAVQNARVRVKTGEVVVLVGPSGSGKSTLAHLLVDLEHPEKGEIIFKGRPLAGQRPTAMMGGMQLVFQDPAQAVSPRLNVLEAVKEPLDILGWKGKEQREQRAVSALEWVHLAQTPEFLRQPCHALSGGQRQRLSVARALVTEPVLLIADEITAMLDPSAQAVLLRMLKGLQHERGFSMLFITHDLHLARKIADRAYILDGGRVTARGAGFDIFESSETPASGHILPGSPVPVESPLSPPSNGALNPTFT
ncbi:MAG: ABC transporter ATP-binding protein [Desulfobacter sp.]|nr:MAG: ABC transporter ATP-binding protein [Desulfobacter sp.]